MYNIEFTKQAIKDLHRIPQDYAVLMFEKVKQLSVNSHNTTLDVKKLQGVEGAYRLRLGHYRVIYEIDDKKLLINRIKIQSRGNVYGELEDINAYHKVKSNIQENFPIAILTT